MTEGRRHGNTYSRGSKIGCRILKDTKTMSRLEVPHDGIWVWKGLCDKLGGYRSLNTYIEGSHPCFSH